MTEKKFLVLLSLIFPTSIFLAAGASAETTYGGAGVVTLLQTQSAGMLGNCDQLGLVNAKSSSIFGGAIGRPQAIADAKNKTASLGGDTAVITNSWDDFSGSHITAVAYRCNGATPKRVSVKLEDEAKSNVTLTTPPTSNKYDDLKKIEELLASGTLTKEEFESEKKKILAR